MDKMRYYYRGNFDDRYLVIVEGHRYKLNVFEVIKLCNEYYNTQCWKIEESYKKLKEGKNTGIFKIMGDHYGY